MQYLSNCTQEREIYMYDYLTYTHINTYGRQTQRHTHTNRHMAPSQQVSEPLASSEKEGRRTVTQRENVSAQYGKQSSQRSDGLRFILAESAGFDEAAFVRLLYVLHEIKISTCDSHLCRAERCLFRDRVYRTLNPSQENMLGECFVRKLMRRLFAKPK